MKITQVYATKGEYVLLKTDNPCEPFVVAWWPGFEDKEGTDIFKPNWAQGHYFTNILPAAVYFGEHAKGETDFWNSDLYDV